MDELCRFILVLKTMKYYVIMPIVMYKYRCTIKHLKGGNNMKDIQLMQVNGRLMQVKISPAFIQIVEEVNSTNFENARSRIITNILNNNTKRKVIYLVEETPSQICKKMKEQGINLIELMSVNGRPKKVLIKPSLITKVDYYTDSKINAQAKVYTNIYDNSRKLIEYIVSETKEKIEQII